MSRQKKKEERASRVADDVRFDSVWTYFPVIAFYAVMLFASILYSARSIRDLGGPVVVVTGFIVMAWAILVGRADQFKNLRSGIDIVTASQVVLAWLAYGLMMKHAADFVPAWAVSVSNIFILAVVVSTHFKDVYCREQLRKSMVLVLMLVTLLLPSTWTVAHELSWAYLVFKLSLFYALYILIESESRSLNVRSGDTYYRSSERRAVQSGWILMASGYAVALGLLQAAYLFALIRARKKRREKKTDGPVPPGLKTASAAKRLVESDYGL